MANICPHCKIGLRIEGDQFICPNVTTCGYRKDTPYKKIPDQEELLDIIRKLIELLDDVGEFADISYSNNELGLIQSARKLNEA